MASTIDVDTDVVVNIPITTAVVVVTSDVVVVVAVLVYWA